MRHSNSIAGDSKGSVKAWILEGENFLRTSVAGYAVYIPYGIGRLFFKISPFKDRAKFPPAESPAKITFFGLILKYL